MIWLKAYPYIIKFVLLTALFTIGWFIGDRHATEKYLPQIETLKAQIESSDNAAKIEIKKGIENANDIQLLSNNTADAINKYYQRLLSAKNQTGSSAIPASSKVTDGATSEQVSCRPDTGLEQRCAIDANTVLMFQDYVIRNHIPTQ